MKPGCWQKLFFSVGTISSDDFSFQVSQKVDDKSGNRNKNTPKRAQCNARKRRKCRIMAGQQLSSLPSRWKRLEYIRKRNRVRERECHAIRTGNFIFVCSSELSITNSAKINSALPLAASTAPTIIHLSIISSCCRYLHLHHAFRCFAFPFFFVAA